MKGIYQVTGTTGAYHAHNLRTTQAGREIVDVLLVGAGKMASGEGWQTVAAADVAPWRDSAYIEPIAPYPTVTSLAQEAVTRYNLEPERVQRAAEMDFRFNIRPAQYDEDGVTIRHPHEGIMMVRSSSDRGVYIVRPGVCTCPDHANGNVCKHRIAAWIYRELITRSLNAARQTGAEAARKSHAAEVIA